MKLNIDDGDKYTRMFSADVYDFVNSTRTNRITATISLPLDRSVAAELAHWNVTDVSDLGDNFNLESCELPRNLFELNELLIGYVELTDEERRTFVEVYDKAEAPYCYSLLLDYVKSGKVRSTELDFTDDSDEICKLHWKDVFGVEFQSKGDADLEEGFFQALDSRTFVREILENKVGFADLFNENWVCCSREILENLKRCK